MFIYSDRPNKLIFESAELDTRDTSYVEESSEFCAGNYGRLYYNKAPTLNFFSHEEIFSGKELTKLAHHRYGVNLTQKDSKLRYMLVRVFVLKYNLLNRLKPLRKNYVEFLKLDPDTGSSTVYVSEAGAEDCFAFVEADEESGCEP